MTADGRLTSSCGRRTHPNPTRRIGNGDLRLAGAVGRLGGVPVEQVHVGRAVHLHRRRGRRFAQHGRHFAQPQIVVAGELLCHERGVLAGQLVSRRRRRRRDGRAAGPVAGRRACGRRLRGVRRVRGHHSRRRRRNRPRFVVHRFAHRVNRVVPELRKTNTQTTFRIY